ncbi:MAG: glutaredoxin family protein [Halioglobus sp.]|nr:glutaredoxin family protein [Halioglobus sp.]
MTTLTLYSTSACHLCELAKALLAAAATERPVVYEEVDIALSDDMFERYGLRIPVLRHPDGRELGWPFGAEELAAFLQR